MRLLSFYVIGLIFGIGISMSGMANPARILNFFDIAGRWDPSLAFVMGGALGVTALGYHLTFKRPDPILESRFQLPTARGLDARLIGGAAVFGCVVGDGSVRTAQRRPVSSISTRSA